MNQAEVIAAIGIGSNLGDRRAMIVGALAALDAQPEVSVLRSSAIIETDPVGPVPQGKYLNAAALIRTRLSPPQLLATCLAIEQQLGRVRESEARWGPRTLDLDILLYGSEIIAEAGLTIPHPHLHERAFVLDPLREIAPDLEHPALGKTIQCLAVQLESAQR